MCVYQRFVTETLDEKGRLVQFGLRVPESFNFGYDVVDAIAAETPEKRALVWCNQRGESRHFTFEEISRLSNQAANVFSAYGIKKGDRVLVMLKRHYEYWYVIVALHKLGAVAIPATHVLMEKDMEYRVNAVGVTAAIVTPDGSTAAFLKNIQPRCPTLETLFLVREVREGFVDFSKACAAAPETLTRVETRAEEPMLLYFTSGTTGQPKAVLHDHTYALAHIITARYWQNVQEDGLHLSVSDTGWGKASWGKLYGQWLCGTAVMVYDYDQFSPKALLRVMAEYGVNTFCAPPTVFRYLVKRGIPDLPALSYAVTAGESLSPDVARQFQEQTNLTLHEGFGQTETVLLIANLVGEPVRIGSMGKASPLFHVELRKPDGTLAAPGEPGEIVVVPQAGTPHWGIFMGYCGDDASYEAVWKGGVYHTRDIAVQDEDGYYWYRSRTDDVIKSRGYRVSPLEVENVLLQHPAVLECAVTGVPDADRGYAIKATVILSPGFEGTPSMAAELRRYVLQNTAPYKCPKSFVFVSELPKTISGKVRRAEIRRQDRQEN